MRCMRNSPFEDLLAICGPPEGNVPLWTLVRPTRARDASVLAPPPGLHRPQEDSPQIQEVCPRISCGLPLPWEDTKFLRDLLPKQVHRMLSRAAVETATKGSTPRAALETALRLYHFLPLPDYAIADCDLKAAFQVEQSVALVAERVNRVPHRGALRVDFFAYMRNGDVIRFHPGPPGTPDAPAHVMRPNAGHYVFEDAQAMGVGAALHRSPPQLVRPVGLHQPGGPDFAASADDLAEVCDADARAYGGNLVDKILSMYGPYEKSDVTDGADFPWWLVLANTREDAGFRTGMVCRVEVLWRRMVVHICKADADGISRYVGTVYSKDLLT